MKKIIIRSVGILGILFVLFAALLAVIRFYPYSFVFPAYPKVTHTKSGVPGDPVNLVFVGTKDQLMQSFRQAGWLIPDPITAKTSARIAVDSLAHRNYPTAPVSNLYVFGRVQDLAFEKPTTDVQNRGHIRIWKTSTLIGGQLVWIGAATYDSGIELSSTNHFPTHHIAPAVDLERNAVGSDLTKTGLVREEGYAAFTAPILYAHNGGGDFYESDGEVLVINYTQDPLLLNQPVWVIDGLKTGIFLFYDTISTVVGELLTFLALIVSIIAGLALWRFTERNQTKVRT